MLEQINASAGSGKTYTLTLRFLELLRSAAKDGGLPACAFVRDPAAPYALAEILAVTFTNKAATEMKTRVLRDLKALALGIERDQARLSLFNRREAEAWVETVIRRYDALNIRTIDSLLVMLVRLSALPLGLPPDFSPVFNDGDFFDPLYDGLLESALAGDTEVRSLLREVCVSVLNTSDMSGFMPGDRLRSRLREIVRLRLMGDEPLPGREELNAVHARRQVLRADLVDAAQSLRRALDEEQLVHSKHLAALLEGCASWQDGPLHKSLAGSVMARKACLDDCLLKAAKGLASAEAMRAYQDFAQAHDRARSLDPVYRSALELGALALLAAPLADRLEARMRAEGAVPAPLLPRLAALAVSGEMGLAEAFCRLGNRLTHLLVDEFQDTGRDQWATMAPLAEEALSRGGSLTYVGDVKQAIYSWRGGDAALFEEVVRDPSLTVMLETGPTRRSLPVNWRSAPAVVNHNNAVFGRLEDAAACMAVSSALLPDKTPQGYREQVAEQLAATFAGGQQDLPPGKSDGGHVRLTRLDADTYEDLKELSALTLRETLAEVLGRWQAGNVAVLVRKNREAADMAALLTEWGLPVVTENSFRLGVHPLILAIRDFLAFLEFPADDVAFWGFISSPQLFGDVACIDRRQLWQWLCRERRLGAAQSLSLLFRRDFPAAWARFIAPFHDRAGFLGPYDTIQECLRHFRVAERLPEHQAFWRRLLEVAYAGENKGLTSLSAFLDFWEETGAAEKVPMPESLDAVQVLTMHKAKGLEFPVVIVPFHHHNDPAFSPVILHRVEGLPLLTRRTGSLEAPHYHAVSRTALESINLLYVAWTRPTTELHAFITSTARTRSRCGLGAALDVLLADLDFAEGVYQSGTPRQEGQASWRWQDGGFLPCREAAGGMGQREIHSGTEQPIRPESVPYVDADPSVQTDSRQRISGTGQASLLSLLSPLSEGGENSPGRANEASGNSGSPLADPAPIPQADREENSHQPLRWLPALRIFRNSLAETEFSERRRGMLAHACLEALRFSGDLTEDVRLAVEQGLMGFPLPVPNPDEVRKTMQDMLFWYASLPDTANWLRRGIPEQSLMDADGSLRRVDLLVDLDEDGLLTVEYKTGQPGPAHKSQVARYLRLLEQASGRPVRGILVYLDHKRLEHVA